MDLIRILKSHAFMQWLAESVVVFFLIGGLVVLVVGLCLLFNARRTLWFFGTVNRWVSLRRATKPLEVPRDTRPFVQRHRRWLAAIFVAGGIFAMYGLITGFDASAVIFVFGLDSLRPSFASWVVDSARWILMVGNFAAIVLGIALGFFPESVTTLEAGGSHWYSERQFSRGSDTLRLPLDQKVAAFPRASGLVMTFFGLALAGAYGLMLFGVR
jgi:hypothetical protein